MTQRTLYIELEELCSELRGLLLWRFSIRSSVRKKDTADVVGLAKDYVDVHNRISIAVQRVSETFEILTIRPFNEKMVGAPIFGVRGGEVRRVISKR